MADSHPLYSPLESDRKHHKAMQLASAALLKRLLEQHPALVGAMQRKAELTKGANDHD